MRIRTIAAAAAVLAVTLLGVDATPAMASGPTWTWAGTYETASASGTLTTTSTPGSSASTVTVAGTLTVTGSECYQIFLFSSFGFSGWLYFVGEQCGPGTAHLSFSHEAISPVLFLQNCPTHGQFCGGGVDIRFNY